MGNTLNVSLSEAELHSAAVSGAATSFQAKNLAVEDTESTITAKEKGKDSYHKEQSNMQQLGASLSQDAENIHTLGVAFVEFDSMMGALNKQK